MKDTESPSKIPRTSLSPRAAAARTAGAERLRMRAVRGGVGACAVVTCMAWAPRARAQGLQPPPPLGPSQQQPYSPQTYPQQTYPQQTYPQQGLQPPPTLSQQQQQPWQGGTQGSATQQQLAQAERDDSGRGFEIAWANAEAGWALLNLGKELGGSNASN